MCHYDGYVQEVKLLLLKLQFHVCVTTGNILTPNCGRRKHSYTLSKELQQRDIYNTACIYNYYISLEIFIFVCPKTSP